MQNRSSISKLAALLQTCAAKGIIVKFSKGAFSSGYCLLRNEKVIVLNKLGDSQILESLLIKAILDLDEES